MGSAGYYFDLPHWRWSTRPEVGRARSLLGRGPDGIGHFPQRAYDLMEGRALVWRLGPAALHEAAVARSQLWELCVAIALPLRRAWDGRSQPAHACELVQECMVIQALIWLLASPDFPQHHTKREDVHLHADIQCQQRC